MASPQFSTPYSVLSYPSYTPVSAVPVKQDCGSPADSSRNGGAELSLLRTAVRSDVAQQHHTAPLLSGSAAWLAPSAAVAKHTRTHSPASTAPQPTRANAPLYAPPQAVTATLRPSVDALPYYSDIVGLRTAASAVQPVLCGSAVVEVDVQSDVVSVTQAAPDLCAFQQECHSLLAMLNASTASHRPAPLQAQLAGAAAEAPAVHRYRSPSSPPPAVGSSASSALRTERESAAGAASAHTTTFAQLMHEMDDLATMLHGSDDVDSPTAAGPAVTPPVSTTASEDRRTPEKRQRPRREAPRRPDASLLLTPTAGELVHALAGPFWAPQLLKWITFLVERRRCSLERVRAFQETRASERREAAHRSGSNGAAGDGTAASHDTSAAPAVSGLQVTEGLLSLLHSLNPVESDVNSWTSTQQRQVCTRAANLLAEMTATEETVVADLLNDAAAVVTLEREGRTVEDAEAPAAVPAAAADAYKQDMMETIALLEQLTKENTSLRASVEKANGQFAKLREEARREKATSAELGQHYDRMAAETAKLTAQLQETRTQLRQAEAQTKPVPQEEVLRNQLDRQTLHLRDVRAELDDAKDEVDALRRTILQLRDSLVRHRAVIDLLTRRRRERERAAAAAARRSGSPEYSMGPESPPIRLIEDILSGACDPPSTASSQASTSSTSSTEAENGLESRSDNEDERGFSTPRVPRR